jgi:hypothetical protein
MSDRKKLDPTIKSNEIRVNIWDGIIDSVEFGAGVPQSVILSIVETDTNGLQDSIEEERILDNNGDECFVREYQDRDAEHFALENAVDDLLACTELNLDNMESNTVRAIKNVQTAMSLVCGGKQDRKHKQGIIGAAMHSIQHMLGHKH